MSSSTSPLPLLSLKGVSVTYRGGVRALASTNLEVPEGQFLVLLGASGAGKSTLLRSINGLTPATGGTVELAYLPQRRLDRRNLQAHRRRCAMVFQHHHLIGRQSVLDNVLMGRVGQRRAIQALWPWSRQDKLDALAVIERVGLLHKALDRADTLSGGQQQRVGIARALIQNPRLLLADEPVASLDPGTAYEVLQLLHSICRTDRLTAVVSLHQVHLARQFADRIVGLQGGRVLFDGLPSELQHAHQAQLYGRADEGQSQVTGLEAQSHQPASFINNETQPC